MAETAATPARSASDDDHLVGFFGCLYFAGMRPGEAVALRASQCVLPAEGWGRVELTTSEPRAGAAWTDDGEARESGS